MITQPILYRRCFLAILQAVPIATYPQTQDCKLSNYPDTADLYTYLTVLDDNCPYYTE